MSHTASITAKVTAAFLVVMASVVGLASNAYAMLPPDPTPGSNPTALASVGTTSSGTSLGEKVQWMTTGAIAALVIVAVGFVLVALVSRRQHSHVRQLQA